VAASGSAPLSYQWQFNGTNLDGATAETLSLTNVQSDQAGGYNAVVTNSLGSATSAVATLTVLVPPSITLQPSNQTVLVGNTASFMVAASGSAPLSYQWQFNGTNRDGATAETLSLTNVQPTHAGSYAVTVANSAGSVTSAVATLTLLAAGPPIITAQPVNQTVLAGETATFSVAASGSAPLSYQWQFNGTNLDGATAETLSLTNVQSKQAGSYWVTVTNEVGITNSAVATLTVIQHLSLLAPRTTTNKTFAFTLYGDAGHSYLIEVTTNFQGWAELSMVSNITGQVDFTDSTASTVSSNRSRKFYRARLAD
jgi:hypothetical protein